MGQDPASLCSAHASLRARQRGVSNRVIAFLLDHADRELPAGGRCTKLTLSRRHAECLLRQGAERETVERAARLALVVGSSGRVVTVMHQFGQRGGSCRRLTTCPRIPVEG